MKVADRGDRDRLSLLQDGSRGTREVMTGLGVTGEGIYGGYG
jgi:hypothetical protein